MSVINTGNTVGPDDTKVDGCTFCSRKLYAPFVYWNIDQGAGSTETFMCADCCLDLQRGLIQDMIQVGASKAIERATGNRVCMVRATPREVANHPHVTPNGALLQRVK